MKRIALILLTSFLIYGCSNQNKKGELQALNVIKSYTNESFFKPIVFKSKDGLDITADAYFKDDQPITVLLCHQAGFSRGEYKDSALKLNELGFSALAIDQRSGNSANSIINETAKLAKQKGIPTGFLDARQDIEAAIDYIYKHNGNRKVILVGSSYSASLSLLIGNKNDKVKAVAVFSPGEYFNGIQINEEIADFSKPLYVTASNQETKGVEVLVSKIKNKSLTHYKPSEKGIHGSRALWETTDGVEGYWKSFSDFLMKNK